MKSKWLLGVALTVIPGAFAAGTVVPGTVNYVEGQVTINGKPVVPAQNGSTTLAAGQTLSVGTGKVEILLSPGTFLRAGNGSQILMITSDLAGPRVEVLHGEAMVEVDYKPKMARLDVMEHGADMQLLKEGLYRFDAEQGRVQVIKGKAMVTGNGRSKDVGEGKELGLANATLKTDSFNLKSENEDELYRWSSVRDGYLAQANYASAENIYVSGGWGPGWGTGWYWNPYYGTYAWLPGDGYFWSPFGYPFFSPGYVVYAPGIRFRGYPGVAGAAIAGGRAGAIAGGRVGAVAATPRVSGGGFARAGGGRR